MPQNTDTSHCQTQTRDPLDKNTYKPKERDASRQALYTCLQSMDETIHELDIIGERLEQLANKRNLSSTRGRNTVTTQGPELKGKRRREKSTDAMDIDGSERKGEEPRNDGSSTEEYNRRRVEEWAKKERERVRRSSRHVPRTSGRASIGEKRTRTGNYIDLMTEMAETEAYIEKEMREIENILIRRKS